MGYPVMGRMDNLPQDVRNGRGLGAAQVIGWLPIVWSFNLFEVCSFSIVARFPRMSRILEKPLLLTSRMQCGMHVWKLFLKMLQSVRRMVSVLNVEMGLCDFFSLSYLYWQQITKNSMLYNLYCISWWGSNDYRSIMALIRGSMSLFPCPVCLVPTKEQGNLLQVFPLRRAEVSKALVQRSFVMQPGVGKAADNLLKTQGLRQVHVCGWFCEDSPILTWML